MKVRAAPHHPIHVDLNELWFKMDELGVQIDVCGDEVTVTYRGQRWRIEDLDDGRPVGSFPPGLEYKLTREDR